MAISGSATTIIIVFIFIIVVVVGTTLGVFIYRRHKEDIEEDLKREFGKKTDSTKTNQDGVVVDGNGNPVITPFDKITNIDPPVENIVYVCDPADSAEIFKQAQKLFPDTDTLRKLNIIYGDNDVMEIWKSQYSVFYTDTGKEVNLPRPYKYTSLYSRNPTENTTVATDATSYIIVKHLNPKACVNKYLSIDETSPFFSYKCNKYFKGNLGVNLYLRITVIGVDNSVNNKTLIERLSSLEVVFVIAGSSTICKPIQIKSMVGNEILTSSMSLQTTFEVVGFYPIVPLTEGVEEVTILEDAFCHFQINWEPSLYFSIDQGSIGFSYI